MKPTNKNEAIRTKREDYTPYTKPHIMKSQYNQNEKGYRPHTTYKVTNNTA